MKKVTIQDTNNIKIFQSYLNKKYRLVPFNVKISDTGLVKYLPPVAKEWKNTVYMYNKNSIKNISMDNINANKIIRSYFNLFFMNQKFIGSRLVARKKRRIFLRRIYLSKMETKHTNSKSIISFYTLNIHKNILYKKYSNLSIYLYKQISIFWKNKMKSILFKSNTIPSNNNDKTKIFLEKYRNLTQSMNFSKLYLTLYLTKIIKYSYYKKLSLLRKHELNYLVNKIKFQRDSYLFKLSEVLSKLDMFNNSNIEFNIINLKSVTLNSDIFTHALSLKLRRKNANVIKSMKSILNRTSLPSVNRVVEKSRISKINPSSIFENNYKNLNLISIFNSYKSGDYNLTKLLNNIHSKNVESKKVNYTTISNIIFNSLKYKNTGGIRLEVKGRLTRRYRADRAMFKIQWKGGLKNIDSSYKGLSTVTFRGLHGPNLAYSFENAKRHVGSFAVKGWISGK